MTPGWRSHTRWLVCLTSSTQLCQFSWSDGENEDFTIHALIYLDKTWLQIKILTSPTCLEKWRNFYIFNRWVKYQLTPICLLFIHIIWQYRGRQIIWYRMNNFVHDYHTISTQQGRIDVGYGYIFCRYIKIKNWRMTLTFDLDLYAVTKERGSSLCRRRPLQIYCCS